MKRYVFEAEKPVVEEIFEVKSGSDSLFHSNYNVIPGTSMPVIVKTSGSRTIISSVWGLDTEGKRKSLFEVPHTDVLKQNHLKQLAEKSPCIVPASGFYKWKKEVDDPLPFYLRVLSQDVIGFAGICTSFKNKEGSDDHAYAVLTMPANALVEPLDNTMPVILNPKEYTRWLSRNTLNMIEEGFSGNHLLPDMSVYRVSELVNDVSNNSKELIQPIPKLRNYEDDDD